MAGTADGGSLYIRSDGASRFRAPDTWVCPTCSTASVPPIASLDFSLTSISSSGPGAYTAAGRITATSDPYWASHLSSTAIAGSPIWLSRTPGGHLTLSVLSGSDILARSAQAFYGAVSPCTVAAVSPPIVAAGGGQQQTVTGVACSVDGEWAAAEVTVHSGVDSWDEVQVLAGNGSTWILVSRAIVCQNHDITPGFYESACGTS